MSLPSGLRLWIQTNNDRLIRETYELFKDKGKVLLFPSEEEVRNSLRSSLEKDDFPLVVVSSSPPPLTFQNYFTVKKEFFSLTFQDEKYLSVIKDPQEREKEKKAILKERTSLTFHQVGSLSLKDLKGMEKLKKAVREIEVGLKNPQLRPKAVFLVGIPGTGKSYSAKCVAGHLKRDLVEFNLSLLFEKERPVEELHRTFSVFEKLPPSIVWIDEIDKVFSDDEVSERIKGQLLTILEEFNTPFGYKGDVLFWITANNVEKIAEKNPEFFRRFDYKFYVRTPSIKEAWEMFSYYFSKFGFKFPFTLPQFEGLVSYFVSTGHKDLISALSSGVLIRSGERLFPFTPAEIKKITEKTVRGALAEGKEEIDGNFFLSYLTAEKPIVVAFKKAIDKMNEQAEMFEEV